VAQVWRKCGASGASGASVAQVAQVAQVGFAQLAHARGGGVATVTDSPSSSARAAMCYRSGDWICWISWHGAVGSISVCTCSIPLSSALSTMSS